MLNSFNSPAFQLACLRFLNTFIGSSSSTKEKVHIQCELEEAGLDIVLLNRMADSSQLKEELQTWARAYIDVNQLVEENGQLRLETEELRSAGKELKERVSVLEASKSYMEDTQRWVEGSSDKERQEEENLNNYRSVNTVVISCNAEPSSNVGTRRFPRRRSRVSRVEVTDTSDSSDKSSFSEKQVVKEENRLEVKVGGEGMTRELEGEGTNGQFMALRGSLGPHSQPVTALNRCKSFFGLRRDMHYQGRMGEPEGLMQTSNGDSFVLKGDSGCGRREVKRSRSMDVLKSRVLRRSRGEEDGLGRGERGESYRSKHEYVSNWAREAFLSGAVQEEAHRAGGGRDQNLLRMPPSSQPDAPRPLDSFYSLYYPGDPMGLKADQEPTYLSMTNNNLPRGLAAKFESDYY